MAPLQLASSSIQVFSTQVPVVIATDCDTLPFHKEFHFLLLQFYRPFSCAQIQKWAKGYTSSQYQWCLIQ